MDIKLRSTAVAEAVFLLLLLASRRKAGSQVLSFSSIDVADDRTTQSLLLGFDNDENSVRKIQFPLTPLNSKSIRSSKTKASALFNELLKVYAPTTFGFKGQVVLDECCRKAGKRDRNQYSADFEPHGYGVVDIISWTLVPEVSMGALKDREEYQGVMADLYKFNVTHDHIHQEMRS
jgi:hypothetical protein